MACASWEDYNTKYLLGREPLVPETEFEYWARQASGYLDFRTSDRLKDEDVLDEHYEKVILATCELAEYLWRTEDSIGKTAESIAGHSITYQKGEERAIIIKHLGNTGLLYRG